MQTIEAIKRMILNGSALPSSAVCVLHTSKLQFDERGGRDPYWLLYLVRFTQYGLPVAQMCQVKGLSYAIRRIWLKTLSRSQTHFGLPNVIYIKLLES